MKVPKAVLVLWATASGVLWALALPKWHWWWGLPLASVALMAALAESRGKRAFFLGWWAGFCQWAVGVSWVMEVMTRYGHLSGVFALMALVAMSAILGFFWGLAAWVAAGQRWGWLLLALGLSAGEVVQGLPPLDFPWNPVVAALVPWPKLLAPLPVLGATLAGFFVRAVLFGTAAALLHRDRRAAAGAAAALALVVAAGLQSPDFQPALAKVPVGVIQPNVPLEVRWEAENLQKIELWVWDLSRQAVAAGARWVVWPESAVPRFVERDASYRQELVGFAREHQVWLTLNSIGFGDGGTYYNSMYSVSPRGELARYDKVHLVPFGEYVPFFGRLAFFRPLVREVGGFTPGARPHPLPGPGLQAGGAVCYEVAFPLHAAAQVRAGAGVLVTVTNDGWYGDTAAPYQHLALAILRAVETRRYLVRAANTGISAVVDPYGRVHGQLPLGERGFSVREVEVGEGLTPASRWAPVLHLAPTLAFAAVILGRAWDRRRRSAAVPRV
ncbi:MAG: apolipoprotein N-acyltransferase [Thermoanaerobaculum sp.]